MMIEILSSLAGQRQGLAADLDLAVGVGDSAVLLGPGGRRQDHVGVFRRLGQEDVLHDEMLQLRQRLAGVLHVRVRHRGVLAHDVHAPNRVGMDRVHDLDDGEAALGIERHAPRRLVGGARLRVLDRLVIGEEHRDQAGVGRALHVVLAAQRMKARARTADLPGRERQRDQAAGVVGAVDVLADAHAPEDDRRFGAGVHARDLAQHRGRNAADFAPSPPAHSP